MARPVEDAVLEQSPLAKLDLRHVLEKNIRQHHFLGGTRLPKCVAKFVKAVVEMETVTKRILAAARFLSVPPMAICA